MPSLYPAKKKLGTAANLSVILFYFLLSPALESLGETHTPHYQKCEMKSKNRTTTLPFKYSNWSTVNLMRMKCLMSCIWFKFANSNSFGEKTPTVLNVGGSPTVVAVICTSPFSFELISVSLLPVLRIESRRIHLKAYIPNSFERWKPIRAAASFDALVSWPLLRVFCNVSFAAQSGAAEQQ